MPGIIIPSLKFEWPKFGANKMLSSGAKMITYFFSPFIKVWQPQSQTYEIICHFSDVHHCRFFELAAESKPESAIKRWWA